MSLTKNLLTVLCFLKWICHDSDENVTRGIDSAGKHSADSRRSKLKEEEHKRKCHQWPSQKSQQNIVFKKRKHSLERGGRWGVGGVSQETNAFYWIRRRKAAFTKDCLQKKDSLLEIRLVLFLGKGWEEKGGERMGGGGNMSKHQEGPLTFESQSYSFSHLHVEMSDIICECQKYLQKIK